MKQVARDFRKQATASEAVLWEALRNRGLDGLRFRRQQPIGPFVVDAYCAAERLVVEVDGGVHETQRERDEERQTLLESLGLRFVRLPANLVEQNLLAALDRIRQTLSSLPLSPRGRGGRGVRARSAPARKIRRVLRRRPPPSPSSAGRSASSTASPSPPDARSTPTTSPCRGCCTARSCARPHPHAQHPRHRHHAAEALPGVFARGHRPRDAHPLRHHPLDARRAGARHSTGCATSATRWPRSPRWTRRRRTRRCGSSTWSTSCSPPSSTPSSAHPRGAATPIMREGRDRDGRRRTATSARSCKLEFGDVERAAGRERRGGGGRVLLRGHHARAHRAALRHRARHEGGASGGRLTVWSARRCRTTCTASSPRCWSSTPARIRVIQPPVGGGFGGKSEPFDLEFCVAKLAMKTGRPVKILYTREEVFLRAPRPPPHADEVPRRRHGGRQAHGAWTRRRCSTAARTRSFGLVTTYYSGQLLTAPYAIRRRYRFDSHARLHQQARLRPQARARQRAAALRLRGRRSTSWPSGSASTRSSCAAATSSAAPPHHQRAARHLERLPPVPGRVEAASGWKREPGSWPAAAALGVAGSLYITRHQLPHLPEPDAAERGAAQGGPLRARRRCSAAPATSARAATRCWPTSSAEELGVPLDSVRVVSADTDFTPVDLGSYSAASPS